jgi:glucose-1-phosphate adenylyltransferase
LKAIPPQLRIDEHWYKGTADAVYQNIGSIDREDPRYVLILASDHVYKMDYGDIIRAHLDSGADLTIGSAPVPVTDCIRFGIMDVDSEGRVVNFQEEPKQAPPLPGDPTQVLASMGIYVFTARTLYDLLCPTTARFRPRSGATQSVTWRST